MHLQVLPRYNFKDYKGQENSFSGLDVPADILTNHLSHFCTAWANLFGIRWETITPKKNFEVRTPLQASLGSSIQQLWAGTKT